MHRGGSAADSDAAARHRDPAEAGRDARAPRTRRRTCPEGTKLATSVSVQYLRLQKGLRTGSIWREIVNFSPNSATAEVACVRKWHVWCRLSCPALSDCPLRAAHRPMLVRPAYHYYDNVHCD